MGFLIMRNIPALKQFTALNIPARWGGHTGTPKTWPGPVWLAVFQFQKWLKYVEVKSQDTPGKSR